MQMLEPHISVRAAIVTMGVLRSWDSRRMATVGPDALFLHRALSLSAQSLAFIADTIDLFN